MNRLITLLTLLLILSKFAIAQKNQPSFGKIDKADLLLKECSYDRNANAMKLIDWGTMYYDRGTAGISYLKLYTKEDKE